MGTCGTGTWTGPKPGDPDNNLALSVVGRYGYIELSWTWPTTNAPAVAHIQVFRSNDNLWANAVQIAVLNSDRYWDHTATVGVTYYYWIRVVTVNGTINDPIGPGSAAALPEIDKMIEILTGQIDAGVLAQTLRNEIDAIPTNRAAFDAEVAARLAAGEITAISITEAQDAADNAIALIAQETITRTSENSALASQINSVGVALGEDIAFVEQQATAGINAVDGKVNSLWTVRLTANRLVGGFGIYNDGDTVQAGFDVDTFWVGRTDADKRKPFIVSGGVAYINNAAIQNASINYAQINTASFSYLSAITANLGDVTAGNITLNQGYAGSWSYIRTRAGKWWSDGVTGFVAAGYSVNNSFFFDVTAGPSYIRMSDGASVGTSAEISLGYGKFVANSSGAVIADTVDIRRRVVLETGQADPPDMVLATGNEYDMAWDAFNGVWVKTWDYGGPNAVFTKECEIIVLTNRYDSTAWDINGSNQPYYVVATPNGGFRQWIGNASDYYVVVTARAVPVRAYSNVGQYANDFRVAIVLHYYIKLIAGSFTQFQLPLVDWTLYKL